MSKVIKAVFTGRFCKTQRVFQFDTDDKLQIVNVDLPASFTVDFSNSKTGDSVSVLATSDTVQIPPDLFVPGSEIYAWIWLSDSNGGHTRCEATIPIDPRARRTGTEPTPAQASAWDEAVDTLNEAAADYEDAMGHGPQIIDGYWHIWDAEAGEYVNTEVQAAGENGADGNSIWRTVVEPTKETLLGPTRFYYNYSDLSGATGHEVQQGDLIVKSGDRIYYAVLTLPDRCMVNSIGSIKGDPGEDGVSPTISSESITGGNRLTIVDAGGTTTVDVMDGQDGADGVGVPSGGAAGDVLRKASGTDYDTEWHSPEIFWAVYDSTTADEIETERIAGKAIMCAWGGKTYVMNYRQNATKFYFTAADRNALYHISVSGSSWSNMSTKTVGTYSKPSGGIPASDLVSGISVPSGGTTGQVLKKASGTDYDTEWANESGGGSISPYTSNPAALGTASPGVSDNYARGDHVHPLPSIPEGADEIEWTGGNLGQLTPPQTVEGAVGVVYDAIPTTASDVGAVAVSQGVAHAGEFVVVGSDGNITTVTMSVWQGGNYGS